MRFNAKHPLAITQREAPHNPATKRCQLMPCPVAAPEIFLWGASRGQNAILSGQKSKNLPKIADFGHFILLRGGGQVGGRASDWGAFSPMAPPLMPPLALPKITLNKRSQIVSKSKHKN